MVAHRAYDKIHIANAVVFRRMEKAAVAVAPIRVYATNCASKGQKLQMSYAVGELRMGRKKRSPIFGTWIKNMRLPPSVWGSTATKIKNACDYSQAFFIFQNDFYC